MGIHLKRFNEVLLMNTHNLLYHEEIKTISILFDWKKKQKNRVLSGAMLVSKNNLHNSRYEGASGKYLPYFSTKTYIVGPSWICGRERMTVENISWSIPTKKCRPGRGWTHSLLIFSQMRIQLSHRGRLLIWYSLPQIEHFVRISHYQPPQRTEIPVDGC